MTTPGWTPGPPPYPPPSPFPAQPPRRNKTLRTVLIVVGIVVVLCCGGGTIGAFVLYHKISAATGPVQDAADKFVTDLQDGDTTGAYGMLCAETRSAFSQTQFTQGVGTQPKITAHKIEGINIRNVNGYTSATADAALTLSSGFVEQHTLALVKEDGTWKICGQPY